MNQLKIRLRSGETREQIEGCQDGRDLLEVSTIALLADERELRLGWLNSEIIKKYATKGERVTEG